MGNESSEASLLLTWKIIISDFFIIRTILPLIGVLILYLILEFFSAGSWSDALLTIAVIWVIINFFKFVFVVYLKLTERIDQNDDQEIEMEE